MRIVVSTMALLLTFAAGADLRGQDLPDLKVVKVEIIPYTDKDATGDFFRDRPLIVAAPIADKAGEPIKLPTYRSYRFLVTVDYTGALREPFPCLIRTESVRDGKTVVLGKTRVIYDPAPNVFACYNVFPAEGGLGDCVIRTSVEAHKEGKKGIALEFKASIVR